MKYGAPASIENGLFKWLNLSMIATAAASQEKKKNAES